MPKGTRKKLTQNRIRKKNLSFVNEIKMTTLDILFKINHAKKTYPNTKTINQNCNRILAINMYTLNPLVISNYKHLNSYKIVHSQLHDNIFTKEINMQKK